MAEKSFMEKPLEMSLVEEVRYSERGHSLNKGLDLGLDICLSCAASGAADKRRLWNERSKVGGFWTVSSKHSSSRGRGGGFWASGPHSVPHTDVPGAPRPGPLTLTLTHLWRCPRSPPAHPKSISGFQKSPEKTRPTQSRERGRGPAEGVCAGRGSAGLGLG